MVYRVPGAAGACGGLARSPLGSLFSGGSPVENSELQLETTCLETEDVPLEEKSQCLSARMTALGRYLLFSCASSRVFMGCYQGQCRNNACFCLGFNLNYRWPGGRRRPGGQPPLDAGLRKSVEAGRGALLPGGVRCFSPGRVLFGLCSRELLGNSSAGRGGDAVSVASCCF